MGICVEGAEFEVKSLGYRNWGERFRADGYISNKKHQNMGKFKQETYQFGT